MEGIKLKNKKIKLAIASGKGGTGKTLLSTSLFYALQEKYENLTLVDCDAEEPNSTLFVKGDFVEALDITQKTPEIDVDKCTFCGKCHDWCAYNAIFIIPPSKIIRVIDELCHGCGACSVACEHGAITEKDVVQGVVNKFSVFENANVLEARMRVGVMSPVPVIKAAIKEAGNNGVVLYDSPPGTSCPFIQTVNDADFIVLITEPTPFGLSDLKQSVETLKTMNRKFGVVINRAGMGDDDIYQYLKNEKIDLLLEIPFDREIAKHYSEGKIVSQYMPEFKNSLISMFDKIIKEYGNSNN